MTSPHLVAVFAEQRGAELRCEALAARLRTGLRSAPAACCATA